MLPSLIYPAPLRMYQPSHLLGDPSSYARGANIDDSLILPRHLSLRDIYLWDILLWVLLLWGHTSTKLKKAKLLTGLTIALKENYKYAQKQNLRSKTNFCLELKTVI
jgi:hypothetical protein